MADLSKSPAEFFTPDNPNVVIININGYNVPILELSDKKGTYIAIPALYKELSDIANQFINGHYITEIDYDKFNGKVAIIKAYY
ncbi:MAG: hypothetical protein ACI4D1_02995 [Lachnospira sp.]